MSAPVGLGRQSTSHLSCNFNQCTTLNKVIFSVAIIFSLFLISLGLYCQLYLSGGWDNFTLTAMGIAGLMATCVGGTWKVCRVPDEQRAQLNHPKASQGQVLSRSRATQSFTNVKESILPSEIFSQIFSYLGGCLSDLSHSTLVCKHWYHLINKTDSPTKHILDDVYGQGYPLHQQVDENIHSIFQHHPLWMIPTTSHIDFDLFSDDLMGLIPYFESKGTSVLRGQDADGRWILMMRCRWKLGPGPSRLRPPHDPREGDGMVVLFQTEPGKKKWLIKGDAPGAWPSIMPKDGLDLDAVIAYRKETPNVVAWIKKLISNKPCGKLGGYGSNLCEIDTNIVSFSLF